MPKTKGNHGVWALPDGANFYAWSVKQHTTTDMTPDQVHALGLSEVARIEAEMDAILRAEGLTQGSVGSRVKQLGERPEQLYADNDSGRKQILADYQTIIDEIDRGLAPYFDVRPKVGVKVERVPVFREKTAPGAYYNPAAFDGSRPGIFYANLRNVAEIQKFGMRTLAYHEAILDITSRPASSRTDRRPTYPQGAAVHRVFRSWALYAERLALEIGFRNSARQSRPAAGRDVPGGAPVWIPVCTTIAGPANRPSTLWRRRPACRRPTSSPRSSVTW